MHMHQIIDTQLASFRETWRHSPQRLEILETGTIRHDTEDHRLGDGWSTLAFAQDARNHDGHVTSIDLHVDTARQVLERHGLADQVTLREGYSIEWMASMLEAGQRFDVILLDSDNNDTLILHEYMLAVKLLRRPGLILVDDVVPGSNNVIKGRRLLPWLDSHSTPYLVVERTGNGFTSGVLSVVIA